MERRKRDSGGEGTTELGRQIERLQRDLTRRERELDEERRETERTIDRMRALEKDKIELKRELDEVRDEVTEYQRVVDELQQDQVKNKGQQKGEEEDGRLSSLRTTLQERNREIGHFIRDLENLGDENETLKNKLTEVSGSLEQATAQLTEMAKDRMDLRTKLTKTEELVGRLEEEKSILQIRERELLDFKVRHDQQLENLGNAVDIRVDVWKKMMFQKDEEIELLHSKVNDLINKPSNGQLDAEKAAIQRLKMKVKEREHQIRQLAQQLQEATEELNNNTKVIQNLQVEIPHCGSGEETDRVLRSYEKKLRKLESKVEKKGLALGAAEKEAEEKTREIVMLSARLREYETGQYGLSDAVAEIKDIKGQLRIRDRDLNILTQDLNKLQIEGSELAEENEMLRKKLGHSPQEDLSQDRKIFAKKREGELNSLKTKLEVMENEITTLKTRNYELKKLLSAAQEQRQSLNVTKKGDEVQEAEEIPQPLLHEEQFSTGKDAEGWREKYDIILHENTELRKGLQEILDSFQRLSEDDGCSLRIESPILENLLREMSARGLINYPYSISSFHLKVCNLEGKNSQLREELHRTRLWAEGLIEKEKQRCEEWREKAMTAQEMVKDGDGGGKEAEFKQRVKEAQLETSRWKRIAEQSEKLNSMLNEKLEESDAKMVELETRLDSMPKERPSLHRTPSVVRPTTESIAVQTETFHLLTPEKDSSKGGASIDFETRLRELENLLAAKDEVIENLQSFSASYDHVSFKPRSPVLSSPEMEEGLQLARETIQSLTDRLRAKEDNLNAYKRLLAEVRAEMQLATERHVQDMNALQSTIHQQQQAFTRMKSTLSHPVRDNPTSDIEGIMREQLTRINELEECVRDLEHTMGNVASQLAAARSDAHRSRLIADTRLKEIDHLREQLGVGNSIEIESLQEKMRTQEEKISELKRSNQNASVLKELLEEKEIEIQSLRTSVSTRHHLQKAPVPTPTLQPPDQRLAELEHLRKTNHELQTKLAKLQVRLSKMNATNRASGMTQEMEELRNEYAGMVEQRDAYRAQVNELERHGQEEDEKKRRTVDGFARWEEGKRWKKTVERLEEQKRKVEEDRNRMSKQIEDLRALLARLEKDKLVLESRLKRGQMKSSTSEQSLISEGAATEKLRGEIQGLRALLDQKELQASESVERLIMEAQILRERIETQERQLTAYEVSQKGDPKVVSEIQKLVQSNQRLQQDLANQQQANLDLKLQIQEMKLETPRLRDRVQHLQKLVDTFKNDKSGTQRGTSARSLGELEKTISALKSVVEKLEKEKGRPAGVQLKGTKSALRLRERQEGLIEEKERLMYQIQEMEEEREKARQLQVENEARIGDLLHQRDDAQSRAQSAEMRLTTFLEEESMFSERMQAMEKEIERKSQLLVEAKKSIEEITKGKRTTKRT